MPVSISVGSLSRCVGVVGRAGEAAWVRLPAHWSKALVIASFSSSSIFKPVGSSLGTPPSLKRTLQTPIAPSGSGQQCPHA